MTTDRQAQQIKLRDGRSLGFGEYGEPEGASVFYFHGFPGSRIEWPLLGRGDCAAESNVRIIAIDRPGSGLSDPLRKRRLLDWPDDVAELADALGIGRFSVLGISGGGPFAAACSFKIPDRLLAAGIVCGMGPADAPGMTEGGSWALPGRGRGMRRLLLLGMAAALRRRPEMFMSRALDAFAPVDRAFLERPGAGEMFVAGLQEALRPGVSGALQDAELYARPWGFRLEDINVPVYLWHGGADITVPISVGRYVASAIPECRATFLPDEGHFTLPYNHMQGILRALSP